jgi:putative tryptophan/tyrosine transport system substrate-binding protein
MKQQLDSGARIIRRRDLMAMLGGAAAAWPLDVQAQQPDRMRHLGVLLAGGDAAYVQATTATLLHALAVLGWHDGGNLRIDWRVAGADAALFERYAAELVALSPDVLLAGSNPAVAALKRDTSTIPIVFVNADDPVGLGYVESLARPGGNVTGFSLYDPPMAGKWVEMLTQITPPVARVAVLYDPSTRTADPMLRSIEAAARSLAVAVQEAPVRDDADIETAIANIAREGHGGLLVPPNPLSSAHQDAIVALAARYRVPAVYWLRSFVAAGGLMSYGTDLADPFPRAAGYIDRILKGAKPSDLPVQNPTTFELAINLKTAKALGVTLPLVMQMTANEVIE